jgi:hypothetical protein
MAPYVYDFSVQDAPTSSNSAPPTPATQADPLPSTTVTTADADTKQKKAGYQCTEYTVDRLGLKNCTKWAVK